MPVVEGIKSVPSVCVCLSVGLLTEPFDIQAKKLVETLLEGLYGKNTDKEGTTWEGMSTTGCFLWHSYHWTDDVIKKESVD